MELVILIAILGCCGLACANIATTKNRNAQTWFFLGVLFGIFAIAAISLLPTLS